MRPLSTFPGKCVTLLIGGLLLWSTVMDPRVAAIAAALLGAQGVSASPARDAAGQTGAEDLPEGPRHATASLPEPLGKVRQQVMSRTELPAGVPRNTSAGLPLRSLPRSTTAHPALSLEQRNQLRIQEISRQLKELGASYLLLERLSGSSGDRYRVRCDLAHETSRVKCCFEVTRDSAVRALEEVLEAVLRADRGQRDTPSLATST